MTIFQEKEKVYRVVSDSNEGQPHVVTTTTRIPEVRRDQDEYVEVTYRSTVAAVTQRLEVMGFTLAESVGVFNEGVAENIEELRQYKEEDDSEYGFWSEELQTLEQLCF